MGSAPRTGETSIVLPLLWRQLASPLSLILVLGAALSFGLGETLNGTIILAIVLASSLVAFFQEYRAQRAIEGLRRRLGLKAKVIRDGVSSSIPVDQIVVGDIITLSAGDLVPADGRILEALDFLVVEANLTGESLPVEKRPGMVAPQSGLTARSNMVLSGTNVRSGTATAVVTATGADTEFGKIAGTLSAVPEPTEFSRGIRHFGMLLMRVMVAVVLAVVATNQFLGRPLPDSILFAVALAVGLSPELLPAIVTVTLSAGARRLSGMGVLVRRLEAIENLGSMDVLCTDKTGTLTRGEMQFEGALDANGTRSERAAALAFTNAHFETGIENPLDVALMQAAETTEWRPADLKKLDEIPYDFQRRRLTVVVETSGTEAKRMLICKGAFAEILAICDHIEDGGIPVPLNAIARQNIEAAFQQRSAAGFRVLAVAAKDVAPKSDYTIVDETALVFCGLLLFADPARADAPEVVERLRQRGVAIKMITGDNRHVAAHVAQSVGLDAKALLTGEELANMRDEALWSLAPRTDLFVEIDPQQKQRIVRALQQQGHAVGYLGDGINDAPALRTADVGISVETAVDVARESADIVLLDTELSVVLAGIEDGRRTFANTLKYIAITTSANFGNMISMAIATPLLPFLPMLPKQILLNNFLSDLPLATLAADNVEEEFLSHPQRWNLKRIQRFMLFFGLLSSIFDLLTFGVLISLLHAQEAEFQTAWFIMSLLTELLVVLVLRTRRPVFRGRPGKILWGSVAFVSLVALCLPFTGPLAEALGFVPLPYVALIAVIGVVAGYVGATEATKRVFYNRE